MKILFLSSGSQVPSSRFRIQAYVDRFQHDGHQCVVAHSFPQKYDYFPWMGFRPSQLLKRSIRWWHWLRAKLQRFDIVYVEREIFDAPTYHMEERFRTICPSMILDIDDAVFLRYPDKFDAILPMFDLVVCGNRFICDAVSDLNSKTICVPTSIDVTKYPQRPIHSNANVPVVGWIGTAHNLQYFSAAAEALRTVSSEREFRLRLVVPETSALDAINLSGVAVEHHDWSASSEVQQLQSMDIGLMPLSADEAWAKYKCGAKLLQYLAVGVPGIASPIGVNAEILAKNRTGFSATSTRQWIDALNKLLDDASLRQKMGQAGRELVCNQYSIQANYPLLRDALLRTING